MNKKTIDSVIEALRNSKKVLITAHIDPDGDSLGSQLAMNDYLESLGKETRIYDDGAIPSRYLFLEGIEKVFTDPAGYDFDPDLVVVLETTQIERTGYVAGLIKPGTKIMNIDHHPGNTLYGDIPLIDEQASSVGEIVYKILKQAGYTLSKATAEKIFTAILTDTGRFHFSSTTPDSLRIAAELLEAGVEPREITDNIYFSMNQRQLLVIGGLISTSEMAVDGKVCALTLTRKMLHEQNLEFSDFEGVVEFAMRLRDVSIGVLFKDTADDRTKISLRSRSTVDVSQLAKRFGGGGHFNAAGATINEPLDNAKAIFFKYAEELLNHHE
ncbi:MAG: bifunctional oligoribonuclease/PAP phosphatase NrnA [candidate division Zixibacteria bacterium]|nr:bifunctional oligoribonuclease/PAP phosphatase NrnA [candidate division Zixibacteria bacterium]